MSMPRSSTPHFLKVLTVAGAVLVRPRLWASAIRAIIMMAPRHWWRRRPFLPLPQREYLVFRLQTQYGGSGSNVFEPADVMKYLRWLKQWA